MNQAFQMGGAHWSLGFMLLAIIAAVILAILLIKLLVVASVALFHPHVLGVLGGVAVLFLLFVGLFSVRQHSVPQAVVMQNRQNPPMIVNDRMVINDRMMLAKSNPAVHDENSDDESTNTAEPAPTKQASAENIPAENTASNHSNAAGSPPPWTAQREHHQGDNWLYVVHLGRADTALPERDSMLDVQMSLAAQQCIDDHLYPGENVSKIIRLDPEFLRSNFIKQTYPPSENIVAGQDFYAQLQFGKDFRTEVERRYSQIISWDHLQQLGKLGVVAMAVLGGLYIYLRTTAAKIAANSKLEVETAKT